MFIKVTSSGPRRYVQLVEAYRDDSGAPKQRTVATLGRLDQLSASLESVISGLLRVTGKSLPSAIQSPQIEFKQALDFGDVWTLDQLWCELGFNRLSSVFRTSRHQINIEALIRIMVFNRLCDPHSKLGVLRWLETVSFPNLSPQPIEHHHLLRAMDALNDKHLEVDQVVSGLLRPLIDQDLAIVFYDMTTIRTEGISEQADDVRQYGMSKEGLIARQVMLGVVQTADGLPLYHEIFEGNTAEVSTIQTIIAKIIERYPIKRIIAVADRGLLSIDNLTQLQSMRLPSGNALEFILAVPGRRYSEFIDLMRPIQAQCTEASQEMVLELAWNKLRLIVSHNQSNALAASTKRDSTIERLEQCAALWVGKLDEQDTGKRTRGRKLSDGGARAKFYHEVCQAHLSRIVRVDLKSELFNYSIDNQALEHARLMDGKLMLVTNTADLTPTEVVERYKSLADIERGFRVLKSEIEIGPMYHRLPQRIKAHASICFMALILYRVMRGKLKEGKSQLTPEKALEKLRRIQHQTIILDQTQPIAGLSTITQEHLAILSSLKIKKPTLDPQMKLL